MAGVPLNVHDVSFGQLTGRADFSPPLMTCCYHSGLKSALQMKPSFRNLMILSDNTIANPTYDIMLTILLRYNTVWLKMVRS